MSFKADQAPKPADVLYTNLFIGLPPERTYELLSEGISACCQNAERLLADAEVLEQADHFCTARFLLTTAREELAKPYILLDACRLDFNKHVSVLRALCRAFYNHIAKHGYIGVKTFRSLDSMAEVVELWKIEVKRWWPTPPENGEPSMRHDTYFDRELPLYVDFDDYSRRWVIPDNDLQRLYFIPILGESVVSRVRDLVRALRDAEAKGLFTVASLRVINEVFRTRYVGDDATAEVVDRIHREAATRVEQDVGISADSFLESTIVQWPLYHCVS